MEQVETKVDVLAQLRTTYCSAKSYDAIDELIKAAKHARVTLYHATEAARSQRAKAGSKQALDRIEDALRSMGAL